MREAQDTTGSLTNRTITVTGFVLNEAQGVDLGRIVIICCAADAQLARIHLRGPAAAQAAGLPDNTWLRVEGEVIAGPPTAALGDDPDIAGHRGHPHRCPGQPLRLPALRVVNYFDCDGEPRADAC